MKLWRKIARQVLCNASRTNFWQIVNEAKITEEDQQILDMKFISGLSVQEIAVRTNRSPEQIKRIIGGAYDKVYRLL